MTTNSLVEQWTRDRANVTRDQFRAQHPYAFLVWSPSFRTQQANTRPSLQPYAFNTHGQGLSNTLVSPVSSGSGPDEVLIWPLRKAPGSSTAEGISVGRAPNCDIVIRDSSVSKLHGFFRDITLESAVYTDAKSANGTYVDGLRQEPGIAVVVKAFSQIVFGRIRVTLFSPWEVYDWLGQPR